MKAPASIFVVSSLFLATSETVLGETNAMDRANASVSQPSLSRSSLQILQLTQAGMDESVVASFISNSGTFQLSADQVVYLNDLGVSGRVIQAMLAHDREKLAASKQNTNTSNVSVVIQQEAQPMLPVEQPTFQSLAQDDTQADAKSPQLAVVPASLLKTEMRSKEGPAVTQKSITPRATQKKKVFYPVREPYAVELTAPIVFLDGPTF